MTGQELWDKMMAIDVDEMEIVMERDALEPGRTFSQSAMADVNNEMIVFVGTRVMRRWNATNEPPSILRVEIKVTVG